MKIRIKYFVIFVLLCISSYSFSQDTVYLDAYWEKTSPEDATYYSIDTRVQNGWERKNFFAHNNQVQMVGIYSSLRPDTSNGKFTYYYEDGTLRHVGEYRKSLPAGTHKWYYENGKLESIESYFGKPGELHGLFQEYYEDGTLAFETRYRNGKMHGKTTFYRENGSMQSSGEFEEGSREGVWTYYTERNQISNFHYFQTRFEIYEGNFQVRLPNNEWYLNEIKNEGYFQYIFKRDTIYTEDEKGHTPDIHIFISNARRFKKDVKKFSLFKREFFIEKGVQIEDEIAFGHKDYPFNFDNGILLKASHILEGEKRYLYMVHFINGRRRGVQIYMDIPAEIKEDYKDEFYDFMKSIKQRGWIHFF
ncbi:MAG: toxin-antitoxin system YwqK family antitoxin [Cytophagaceae bacterium]